MNQNNIYKSMLSEIDKRLTIFSSFPVTSATAERIFIIALTKNIFTQHYVDCWLNNLFLLYVHLNETDALDLREIANEFVSVNSPIISYFGKL